MTVPADEPERLWRVSGSALAVLGAWVSVMGTALAVAYVRFRMGQEPGWRDWTWIFFLSGGFVLAAWVFVVAPLHWFVPARSRLWHWPIAASVGALAGGAIFCALLPGLAKSVLSCLAIAIGAVTGLLSAWLARRNPR